MIIIKNFEIINDGQSIAIDLETNVGFNIVSVNLWKMDDFKNETLAINLNYKLEKINNKEVFIITAAEANVNKFEDIFFIEVKSNFIGEDDCSSCSYPALGVTYNLSKYYQCMLDNVLQNIDNITTPTSSNKNISITVNLLINSIENAIEIGLYSEAILMIAQLRKICGIRKCKNCKTIYCNSCNGFKQL